MTEPAEPGSAEASETANRQDAQHAARSGAVQLLTIAAQALLTITHVLLARLFGREVFGSYQTSAAILEVLTRGGSGGADKGMLRYVAGHRARGEPDLVRRALGTGLRLCLMTAGSAAVVLMVGAGPIARLAHEPTLETALRLMAPAAVFTSCLWVLMQASLAHKVTRVNFIVRGLGEPVFVLGAGLIAAAFGRTIGHMAMAHVAAAMATVTLAVVAYNRTFGRGEVWHALRAPRLPGFIRFSLPVGVADLMNAVLQRADIVLLTAYLGANAAAVYAAGEFITRVIANARYVFDSVAAPVFSEALHLGQRDRLRGNLVLMTRWVASAAAPIAVTVLVLRGELLSLYGSSFRDGADALVVLAIGHTVNATLGLSGWILLVGGHSRALLINNIVVAVVNVVLGVLLIPRFGLVGTAMAALGSVTLLQLIVLVENWYLYRVHPFGWALAKPFVAAAAALGAQLAVTRAVATTGLRVPLVIVVGVVTYAAAMALLRLPPEDQRVVSGFVARIRARWARH